MQETTDLHRYSFSDKDLRCLLRPYSANLYLKNYRISVDPHFQRHQRPKSVQSDTGFQSARHFSAWIMLITLSTVRSRQDSRFTTT